MKLMIALTTATAAMLVITPALAGSLEAQVSANSNSVETWFDSAAPIGSAPPVPVRPMGAETVRPGKGTVAPQQTGTKLYVPLTDEQQLLPVALD